jgi:hypothetical protein
MVFVRSYRCVAFSKESYAHSASRCLRIVTIFALVWRTRLGARAGASESEERFRRLGPESVTVETEVVIDVWRNHTGGQEKKRSPTEVAHSADTERNVI